jgi:hypothetical protein
MSQYTLWFLVVFNLYDEITDSTLYVKGIAVSTKFLLS